MIDLMEHQSKARDIARRCPRFAFFHDCGTGKTISMLAICDERRMPTLVLCPRSIIDAAWLHDARHFDGLKVISGRANSAGRRRDIILANDYDLIVLNYESAKRHVDDFLQAGIRRLIIDESSALKNHRSQTTLACLHLSQHMDEVYLLSGTPAPNEQSEFWAQLACVHPERTARNYWQFCRTYMTPIERKLRDRTVITGWAMRPERRAQFEELLSERCWFLRKQDCVDLPEQVDQFRNVELSQPELEAYSTMRDELRAEFKDCTINATAASQLMKLRQLAGGILYDHGVIHEIGESKLRELVSVLDEIGDQPVVIWAEFTADIDRIASRLSSCRIIDGRTSDRERQAALSEFGDKFQYLVCHPRAVGHGVTMTQASYAIYYSLGFSYEMYVQSRDRIHRIGQTQCCTYVHLLATNTCDLKVLEILKNKGTLHEAMRAALEDSSVGTRKRETVH